MSSPNGKRSARPWALSTSSHHRLPAARITPANRRSRCRPCRRPVHMTPEPTSHDILASWQYTPEEWRRFGEYEGRHYRKVIGQTKTCFIVLVILFIAALAMVPAFGFLQIVPWDRYMLNAVFVIALVGVGFMG